MISSTEKTEKGKASEVASPSDIALWAKAINKVLERFSDKDWNYSRIYLIPCCLKETLSPYVLGIDWLDMHSKQGKLDCKTALDEVTWGERHSSELGMLEVISLRLNRALSEVTTADYWHGVRPILRLQKRSDLLGKDQTHAFWYRIEEVQGEEFENR